MLIHSVKIALCLSYPVHAHQYMYWLLGDKTPPTQVTGWGPLGVQVELLSTCMHIYTDTCTHMCYM